MVIIELKGSHADNHQLIHAHSMLNIVDEFMGTIQVLAIVSQGLTLKELKHNSIQESIVVLI